MDRPKNERQHDTYIGRCPRCSKLCFTSRKSARLWAKKKLPSEHWSFYMCGDYWHYGHKAVPLLRGIVTRQQEKMR